MFGRKSIRTEILRDHCAITEDDHPSGQSMGWKVRTWDQDNGASQKTGTAHIYRSLHARPHMISIHVLPVDKAVTRHGHRRYATITYTSTSGQCGTLAVLQHFIDRQHYIIDGQGVRLQDPSSLM